MSMNAIRQLNSGGLKLKSNFSARSVAANVAANRGSAAAMVKNSNYTFGSNLLFTPARSIGGTSRYASSSALSRALNGQNMRFVSGGGIPAYSGVSFNRNFTEVPSDVFNAGLGLGSAISLGIFALKQLKDMGIIGGSKEVKPQGAGDELTSKLNQTFGNTAISMPVSADISNTISAMEGATDKAALSAAISNAESQVATFTTQQGVYQAAAAEEKTQLTELQSKTESLQKAQSTASQNVKTAEEEVKATTQTRDQVKSEASKFGEEYANAVDKYTQAHDARIDAKTAFNSMQAQSERADASLNNALNVTKEAQTSFNDASTAFTNAQNAYNSEPETITTIDANGNQTQKPNPKKAELKIKMDEAEAKKNVAQTKLRQAQADEQNAKTCKAEADKKLAIAEKQYDSAIAAEKEAETAKNAAAKNVSQNKDKLAEFEAKLDKQQSFVDRAKGKQEAANESFMAATEALDAHKAKMDSLTSMAKLAQDTTNNIQNLNDSISTQKNRLATMTHSDKEFAKTLVNTGTETILQVGHGEPKIKGFYGKNPETGNMVYVDQNGNEYTEDAFKNWEKLAKTGSLD